MIKYPIDNPYILTVEEVVVALETKIETGLTQVEASNRSKKFGLNSYQSQKQKSSWAILFHQFKSPIVYILIVGSIVSVYFKDFVEAIAIGCVIIINALIGFFMELQARVSMNALKKMDVLHSNVVRDSKIITIPSSEIVPGDLIVLEAGDVIPGDARVVESNQLKCDESSLTGESLPSDKSVEKLSINSHLGDQHNMVFKGTSVINGNGKAIVVGIAKDTQLGSITSLVELSDSEPSQLDLKLAKLSHKLIWITLVLTIIYAISGLIEGKSWLVILKTSIALAIAAIPEGLPIVATIALAYGMLIMAKKNAIVKKLTSVETLGSTNVILTDKTGTLTENTIHVEIFLFPEEKVNVTIQNGKLQFPNGEIKKNVDGFEKMKLVGALCNNAALGNDKEKKIDKGDPLEIALIKLVEAANLPFDETNKEYERIAEIPFSSETKIMGTQHKRQSEFFVSAKGSVEQLLEKCSKIQIGSTIKELSLEEKAKINAEAELAAGEGLRVLSFAYKNGGNRFIGEYLTDLIYVGTIGFLDPPRLDIKDAIHSCRTAGIRIVMITGDHPMTALNIAKKTGIIDEDDQNVIIGKDLHADGAISEEEKKKILATSVFARVTPKQKLEIADIFQKEGNIVAMTGDGVNDAPALKKADVGIAMGLRGTQVAKETASIVLKDDSFKTIAEAVSHGREIFMNIQKFVIYLVSCNLSEIFIVITLGFLFPASILLPLQILFLNMVTDIFPALALGLGKGDKSTMERPPRDPKKEIISNKNWIAISVYSLVITLSVILAVVYCNYFITQDANQLNSVAFITLTFAQLFHVFNMASFKSNLIVNEITKNKFVWFAIVICISMLVMVLVIPQIRLALDLLQLSFELWLVSLIASILPILIIQPSKKIFDL